MKTLAQSLPPLTASSNGSKPSMSFRTSRQNSIAAYAAERARLLFGSYRRGDANDPETYVAAIAAVLSDYSPETIRFATDPRGGISTKEKFRAFMPNPGELKAFCEEVEGLKRRMAAWGRTSVKQIQDRHRKEGKQVPSPRQIAAVLEKQGISIEVENTMLLESRDDDR